MDDQTTKYVFSFSDTKYVYSNPIFQYQSNVKLVWKVVSE